MKQQITDVRQNEKGLITPLILMLLTMGTFFLVPSIGMANTALTSKGIQSGQLSEQYARDAGTEFAVWNLIHGTAATTLNEQNPEVEYTVTLNGEAATVTLAWHAEQGSLLVPAAEDDKIRPSSTVVCDKDYDGFDDDCLALPKNLIGMVARYTIFLEQISPETSQGLTIAYDELPARFSYIPGGTFSADSSVITVEPSNVGNGQHPILMWDFQTGLGSPVTFNHGQVKQFSFDVDISKTENRYCNAIYLKPNRENTGKGAAIHVGNPSETDGCQGGGVLTSKYVDTPVVIGNQLTTLTYVANIENFDTSTLHLDSIRDILPQGGFDYLANSASYFLAAAPFDPLVDDFTSTAGHTVLPDTELQWSTLGSGRVQLIWTEPHGGGFPNWSIAPAGQSGDTLVIRFQAQVTLTGSGTYFNEIFAGVGAGCSAPQRLVSVGVFTQGSEDEEYCSRYSWPTSGVVVPSFDIRSESGGITGNGNVVMLTDNGSARLNSWHLNEGRSPFALRDLPRTN